MNVKSIQTPQANPNSNRTNKQSVAFTATPEQILTAVKSSHFGPTRSGFLNSIAKEAIQVRKQLYKAQYTPDKFELRLGEVNPIPPYSLSANAEESWAKLATGLDHTAYKERSRTTPGEMSKVSLGEYAKKLLTQLGVEEPNVVALERPKKKGFTFFGLFK